MAAIAIHVPNGFKNLFLCEDIAGIGSKEYKGTVFKAGKVYFLPVPKYPALVLPYFQSRKKECRKNTKRHGFHFSLIGSY